MSAGIENTKDGEARMMYAGASPWHGLGTRVEKEVTSGAAIRLGRLDWNVELQPLYYGADKRVIDYQKGVVRIEDNKLLGVVGNNYTPIQNSEAFDFLDAIVGEGLAMYHSVGSLRGGAIIFICCKFPGSIEIKGDKIDKYLVASTSHDGSQSLKIYWTPIRVVCMNTLQMSLLRTIETVNVRHTLNYKDKVTAAREVLGLTELYYQRLEAVCNHLAQRPMTTLGFREFTFELDPLIKNEDGTMKDTTIRKNRRAELLRLFKEGKGNQRPGVAGTRWAAYNAVTEYVDHYHRPDAEPEKRVRSQLFGSGANKKEKAFELLSK